MLQPLDHLRGLLGPDRVSERWIDRLAYAHDASLYRLVPMAVVRPEHREHIRLILEWCRSTGSSCTFRTGGTSLSGQAVTDGLLVDLARSWRRVEILDNGERVRMQPGITGARVNALLHRYGRKIGPDPASLIAAMIGGIVANNASGMCCGTAQNSYHTLDAMAYVLADGTCIDTAYEDADEKLRTESPNIYYGLVALRDEIRANESLRSLIRRKYRIKNTIGYSLNAFLDEDLPSRILARLLVGSEGTLGFIDSVTLRTVPDATAKWTAFFVFNTLDEACADVERWRDIGAAAIELMDDASLRSFADLPTTPDEYRIRRAGAAALLVEFHTSPPPGAENHSVWKTSLSDQAVLWKLRKGLMPTVGAMRAAGSTMINEDIAVPPEHLAALIRDIQAAFREYGYHDGIIFGHAKDGNIHYVVCQTFDSEEEVQRYADFMDRVAEIVVDRYAGSLKAEHGTGRNMAPFVEKEWGSVAYGMMVRIKRLLDPTNVLNPDVLINADPRAHVKNIKPVPVLDGPWAEIADRCIECGFCEHVCPTRDVTLTPRQRIVIERELLLLNDQDGVHDEVSAHAQYDVIDSCAVDGMCATVCPVGIDTGALVKQRRRLKKQPMAALAAIAARNMHRLRGLTRGLVRMRGLTALPGSHLVRNLGVPQRKYRGSDGLCDLIIAPTCVSQTLQHDATKVPLVDMIIDIAHHAGLRVDVLEQTRGCCGQPLSSQGFTDAAAFSMQLLLSDFHRLCQGRNVPVFIDTTTCAAAIVETARQQGVTIIDQVGFAELILSRCSISQTAQPLILHPGCGSAKFGTSERLKTLAHRLSSQVFVPPSAACCGMGGSHGLAHPEIVAAATTPEKDEISAHQMQEPSTVGISVNTLCESALSSMLGIPFKGLVEILWERMTNDQ